MSDWTVDAAIEAAKKDPASYGRQVFELSNKRIALSNRVLVLETALREIAKRNDVYQGETYQIAMRALEPK